MTPVLLGLTALSWLVLIPAVLCWPAAGFLVYLAYRWAKRHDQREALEREQALRQAVPHAEVAVAPVDRG